MFSYLLAYSFYQWYFLHFKELLIWCQGKRPKIISQENSIFFPVDLKEEIKTAELKINRRWVFQYWRPPWFVSRDYKWSCHSAGTDSNHWESLVHKKGHLSITWSFPAPGPLCQVQPWEAREGSSGWPFSEQSAQETCGEAACGAQSVEWPLGSWKTAKSV